MEKALLVMGAVAVAGAVSTLITRRRSPASAAELHHIPEHLDRADFIGDDLELLIVVFTSATCKTCRAVVENVRRLAGPGIATQEIEVGRSKTLHDKYRIDAVPTTLIVDNSGKAIKSFLGPVGHNQLARAMSDVESVS